MLNFLKSLLKYINSYFVKKIDFMTSKSRSKEIVKFFQRFAIFFRACAVNQHIEIIYKFDNDCFFSN